MKISCVYISHRPGSIDLLADSFRQQVLPAELEWELIVIDGCPGRVQRGEAEAYLRSFGIPVRHYGLPKMHTFPWARTGFANAHNTGLIYSSGTHVIFLNDFCWFPPATVGLWVKAFTDHPDTLICGVGVTYIAPKPDAVVEREGQPALHDVATWKSLNMRRDWTPREPWVPETFDTGYWGGPITYFEGTNGIDERADFCSEWTTACVKAQSSLHGLGLRVDRSLVCHMVDHRNWEEDGEGLYRIKGELADVEHEPVWTGWSGNPFVIKSERARQMELIK